MLNFHNLEITISGVKMLTQSASIDENNFLVPIFAIGHKGSLQTVPNGPVRNSISLEYIVEPGNDISQKLIDGIRRYDFNSSPTRIAIAGKTGMGYINSYSLLIVPNDVIVASVQYDVFAELTGQISEQIRSNFYTGNMSGVGHYWTCQARTYDGIQTGSILQGAYSFRSSWRPIYKIGSPVPVQVKFLEGEERFDFEHEYQNIKITHSGANFQNSFTNFDLIEINPLSSNWGVTGTSIKLYPSSGKLIANKISLEEDSLMSNNTSIVKYY